MKVLLISPYHGGSHRAWAEGYARSSRHEVRLLTMPGQLWKWRMHGSAVHLARQFLNIEWQPDLILADDMLDLAAFLALTRARTGGLPALLYMHENQLTYPLPADPNRGPMRRNLGVRERQYVLINWKSMLAADAIWFNSRFHLESWFTALPVFLNHYPDYPELETIPILRDRSEVVPLGIDLARFGDPAARPEAGRQESAAPPLILWNQRWEFDKNPAAFFAVLSQVKAAGHRFRLAICGENFQNQPEPFLQGQIEFAGELIHFGFAEESAYRKLLAAADIVISTARHEFFGISIIEAIYQGAFPILPHRLSYPELIPAPFHARCLYQKKKELLAHLRWALTEPDEARAVGSALAQAVAAFDWGLQAVQYDQKIVQIDRSHSPQRTKNYPPDPV